MVALVMMIVLQVWVILSCVRVCVASFRASVNDGERVGSPLPENAMSLRRLYFSGMLMNCWSCHMSPEMTRFSICSSSFLSVCRSIGYGGCVVFLCTQQ